MATNPIFYLDDCSDDDDVITFGTQAGYDVRSPRIEGTRGWSDSDHLDHAAAHGYTLITQNPHDFIVLHQQWQAQGRTHSGILLVYRDNNVAKDMKPRDIICALGNLLASNLPLADTVHVLNHWR
jgi:hypothetical protein